MKTPDKKPIDLLAPHPGIDMPQKLAEENRLN